ncbi:MAG TPA: hypothetical protein DDX40_08970 [Rikenellaceae bacterium]|nr:hypothetical protein [Rikenellaceae bacterium]
MRLILGLVIQTHCFQLIQIHSALQIEFRNQVGFLVEEEIGNPFCLLHIAVCCLFICLSRKMWIISVGNILVNIMVIWFVMI